MTTNVVIDPVSGDTVGGGRMFVAGTGLLLALERGEEATIHVMYSAASGRRELGLVGEWIDGVIGPAFSRASTAIR